MTLNVHWAKTPAYALLKPIWDTIDGPKDTSMWNMPEWEQQPPIVQVLDSIMRYEGPMGTPMSTILMFTGVWTIDSTNVATVWSRMRTFETFTGQICLNNVGEYDPITDMYTLPEKGQTNPLSPWMLSMFIGYSANWGNKNDKEWIAWLLRQSECKDSGVSEREVRKVMKDFCSEYNTAVCQYVRDMAIKSIGQSVTV